MNFDDVPAITIKEELKRVRRLEIGALCALISICFGGGIYAQQFFVMQDDLAELKDTAKDNSSSINEINISMASIATSVKTLAND